VPHSDAGGVTAEALTIGYSRLSDPVVRDARFELAAGTITWLLGPNGSGKSTLGLTIAGMLPGAVPGRRSGRLVIGECDPAGLSPADRVELSAIIHQDPDTQLCTLSVRSEVALLLENRGLPPEEIDERTDRVLSTLGVSHLADRALPSLSGGEKQLVALASILVDPPALLVLDEPCAFLDEANRSLVLDLVGRLPEAAPQMSMIIVEHRTDGLPAADAVLSVSADGRVTKEGPDAASHRSWGERFSSISSPYQSEDVRPAAPVLEVSGLAFSYDSRGSLLQNVEFSVSRGEVVVLQGKNGSGKTTLLRLIAGALEPEEGRVRIEGRGVALAPQNPEHLFAGTRVEDELHEAAHGDREAIERVTARFGLASLTERNPYTLSTGQKRRLTLALAALSPAGLVLMDEPTFGLDSAGVLELIKLLGELRGLGKGLLVVTHDGAFAAAVAHRRLVLSGGTVEAARSDTELQSDRRRIASPDSGRTTSSKPTRTSFLGSLNPLARCFVGLLFIVAASFVASPPLLGVWLGAGALLLLSGSSLRALGLLRRLLPFGLIGLGFLWANLLFHRSGEFSAGLENGVMLFLRALVFGVYSLIFVQDLDPEGFSNSLMARLKAPAKLVYATLIAFRLGPELSSERDSIRLALRLRNTPADARGKGGRRRRIALRERLRRTGRVYFGVFVAAFRRAGRITIALEGRGLDNGPRSFRSVPPLRAADVIFVVVSLIFLIGTLLVLGAARWTGAYF
jgi:energy-coupling factor transport system ATP-binding protein